MPEQFICEKIKPITATIDTVRMATGEPGLPREFIWRDKKIVIEKVLKSWRTTKPCHHKSGEKYIRKHWYEVKCADKTVMRIYFDRQPESGRKGMGWWLFTVSKR